MRSKYKMSKEGKKECQGCCFSINDKCKIDSFLTMKERHRLNKEVGNCFMTDLVYVRK